MQGCGWGLRKEEGSNGPQPGWGVGVREEEGGQRLKVTPSALPKGEGHRLHTRQEPFGDARLVLSPFTYRPADER